MTISPEEANAALQEIADTEGRTRQMLYKEGDLLFIVWGLVWLLGFLGTHVIKGLGESPRLTNCAILLLWGLLVGAGVVVTILVTRRQEPVKSPLGKAVAVLWWIVFGYAWLWIGLLFPFIKIENSAQAAQLSRHMGAIYATIPMLMYVIMGLWFGARFLLWVGVVITLLTLVGLFLLPFWFWLWMAFIGGGVLIGAGLYSRWTWRQSLCRK
jgi:hypothetical protein